MERPSSASGGEGSAGRIGRAAEGSELGRRGMETGLTIRQGYRMVWQLTAGHRASLAAAMLVTIIGTSAVVLAPVLTAAFFRAIGACPREAGTGAACLVGHRVDLGSLTEVAAWFHLDVTPASLLLLLSGSIVLAAALGLVAAWMQEEARQRLVTATKLRLYRSVQSNHVLRPGRAIGELQSLIGSQAQNAAGLVATLVVQPSTFGWQLLLAAGAMALASWRLTLLYVGIVVLIDLVLPRLLGLDRRVTRTAFAVRDAAIQEANALQEQLAGRDLIDALDVADAAADRVGGRFRRFAKAQIGIVLSSQVRSLFQPLAALAFPIIGLGAVAFGTPPSAVISLYFLSLPLTTSLQGIVSLWAGWQQAQAGVSLVSEELATEPPARSPRRRMTTPPAVRLEGIEAVLPDGRPVLQGVDADIKAGSVTAVVGRGGTGKSILLDVIGGRFLGVARGTVTVGTDAIPADHLMPYRGQFARLNQEPQLFACSVTEYVMFGVEGAPLMSVEEALDIAGLGLDAPPERRLPGVHAVIGRDFRPSGLQRQALRLAQLLVRRLPPVVLLDEPDSAMSGQDATLIQRVIRTHLAPRSTVVLVTHAPHLLPNDVDILVLENGQVEARGTHGQLLLESAAYRALCAELDDQTESHGLEPELVGLTPIGTFAAEAHHAG